MDDAKRPLRAGTAPGPIYIIGLIGALVYYLQQAHSFGSVVLAVLKSFAWPALLVYDVLKFIH